MDTLNKILKLIKDKGDSQKDLADFLGVKSQMITEWKGRRSTSYVKYIDKIAQYYGVSTDYLLGTEKSPSSEEDGLSPEKREIMQIFQKLTPELQKMALDFVRMLESTKGHGSN